MHAIACRTVIISQSLFATRFAKWHFSMPNKSSSSFFKGVWQRKLSIIWQNLVKSTWQLLSQHHLNFENSVGHFKMVSRTKKLQQKGHTADLPLHCVSKKITPRTCYNLNIHDPITIIFGRNVTKKVENQRCFVFLSHLSSGSALPRENRTPINCTFTGSIARSANLPVFSLLRGRF